MCPNCASEEIGDFLKKAKDLESFLKLNKCHECDCVFVVFDFRFKEDMEMAVSV
ncbi:hypothetical protein MKZ20_17680 [Psychrobacillus sp. FSL K6-2684]|uniref:hypothetical protein n=1 Tax=Psychrobacillus sp. FSL K6-2684 TaxID=2921547 RepID=UPI0030F9F9E9